MAVHPTARVDPRAEIDSTAEIGPFVVIEGPVRVGPGTRVLAHAVLTGNTVIGRDNVIHFGAVVGHEPQDLAYSGGDSFLRIGDRNVIREYASLHRGTAPGSATAIGDDNYIMAYAHVGHNVRMGNGVILCGGAMLAGHVEVGDRAFISGNCVVHQYVRIGRLALLRGMSRTSRDVPPFCVMDFTHTLRGINRVGMRRAGFRTDQIQAVWRAFVRLFGRRVNLKLALEALERDGPTEPVREMIAFIRDSKRGVCFGPRGDQAFEV